MTQIIKGSSTYLEMQSSSFNKKISDIKNEIDSNKMQLNETWKEKYDIDQHIRQIKERMNFKRFIWIIAAITILLMSSYSISIYNIIPIALSFLIVLPITVYFTRGYFDDQKFYEEQNKLYVEKEKKIEDYDKVIREYNEELNWLNNKCDHYEKGLIGEKKVTEMLNRLGDNNYLINDITLDKAFGNIDHILISKHGIFIIETKNWDGEIVCKGDSWKRRNDKFQFGLEIESISKRVKGNARKLRLLIENKVFNNLMAVWIEGIIVFTNADTKIKAINPTIPVLTIDELNNYIKSKPAIDFSSRDLESIADFIMREVEDKHD